MNKSKAVRVNNIIKSKRTKPECYYHVVPTNKKTKHKYLSATVNPKTDFSFPFTPPVLADNFYGDPLGGQLDDESKVYLFKDMVEELNKMITKYGENSGFCNQHFGMGNTSDVIVVLIENK